MVTRLKICRIKLESDLKTFCSKGGFNYHTFSKVENRYQKVPTNWTKNIAKILKEEKNTLFDEEGFARKCE